MMTPPQPAPRSPPAQEASEAEMSFRDLVDESDEEEQAGRGGGKSLGQGQVLVDPEDLQVSTPHALFALLSGPFEVRTVVKPCLRWQEMMTLNLQP